SRLLLLDRGTGAWSDDRFARLPELLGGAELLVFNNARVIPARLLGKRAGTNAQPPSRATNGEHLAGAVDVLLTKLVGQDTEERVVGPGRKLPVGERVMFGGGELEAEIVSRGELGLRTVRLLSRDGKAPAEHLDRLGHVPLPPYIEREDERSDCERYP